MTASQQRPVYSVYIISGDTKYNVTPAVSAADRSESKGRISQSVTLQLMNVQVNGTWLADILKARDRVVIYADDGTTKDEVFRGYLWERGYRSSLTDRDLKFVCYDNLIYCQKSEDSLYFSDGKLTKDIISSICDKWGIKLNYSYESITHAKLPLRGKLYEIFTSDILDLVQQRTGKKYVILSEKDTMIVRPVGANSTIYQFRAGKNVTMTDSGWTMDGIVTKVVIVGKADKDDREPVEATVTGKTDEFGTVQKIQDRDDNTSLEDAKLEAQNTIDESGSPKWEYRISAPDIPWIRKGDKVFVNAGDIQDRYLIVTDVSRTIDNKKRDMALTLEEA